MRGRKKLHQYISRNGSKGGIFCENINAVLSLGVVVDMHGALLHFNKEDNIILKINQDILPMFIIFSG